MELDEILRIAVKNGASDIHFRAGLPPMFRIRGSFIPLRDSPRLSPDDANGIAQELMSKVQRERFVRTSEVDTSYGVKGLGRFRASVFRQRTTVAVAMRAIPEEIASFEELRLPQVLETIANETSGLVLVVGPASCGKTTTMAAMVNHINGQRSGHILTVEDPVEYMFRDKRSVISQREVGVDTPSANAAVLSGLRQDADVMVIGELRDDASIRTAVLAATSGRLVLTTIHGADSVETVNRLAAAFPSQAQRAARQQIASCLTGIIGQRLVQGNDDQAQVPILEVLIATEQIRELVRSEERLHEVRDVLASSHTTHGTQTFDQSLFQAFTNQLVTREQAMRYCTNPDEFALLFVTAEQTRR